MKEPHLQLFDGLPSFAYNEASLACRDDHLLHGTCLSVGRLMTPRHYVIYECLGSPISKSN